MIIDYKNELMHQHTAIKAIMFAYEEFKTILRKGENYNNGNDYYAPIEAILNCIASSHKLDHLRLCCDKNSRQYQIAKVYKSIFKNSKKQIIAVAKYQSANHREEIDSLKPYQIINKLCLDKFLTATQSELGKAWHDDIIEAFLTASENHGLQIGQRLFRGTSFYENQLDIYEIAQAVQQPLVLPSFTSTTLSESVALSFSILTNSRLFLASTGKRPLQSFPVLLELSNRCRNLSFIMPDALRKPERSQGQMEILLNKNTVIKPTFIDRSNNFVKIYADIVS